MYKGFDKRTLDSNNNKRNLYSKEPKGRLISWSPWPPANFQTRYPGFPLVLTLLLVFIGKWYLSLLK